MFLRLFTICFGFVCEAIRSPLKKLFLCAILVVSILMGQACSFLHGTPVAEDVIDLSSQDLGKVSELPDNFAKIFQGQFSDQQIRDTFDNLQYALQYFMTRTKGSSDTAYSTEDMRSFFGKYLLKSTMSPSLAQAMMKLKKAMIGGSDQWLTKTEITRLISIVAALENETVSLNAYIKILTFKLDTTADWNKINAAVAQFRSSVQKMLKLTDLPVSTYTFQDIQNFFNLLAASGSDTSAPIYRNIAAIGPLLDAVKTLRYGTNAGFTGISGWSLGLDGLVDVFEVSVKANFVFSQPSLQNPSDVIQMTQFLAKTLSILTDSHSMQNTGEIPFSNFDAIIEQAANAGFLPSGLTVAVVEKFYRNLVLKIFDPSRPADISTYTSLKSVHLVSLQREVDVWRLSEGFIDQLTIPAAGLSSAQLGSLFDAYNIAPTLANVLHSDAYTLQASWSDFGPLLKASKALVFDSSGRILIAPGAAAPNSTWKSLARLNLMRSLARLLLIGYGDHTPATVGQGNLLQTDLDRWYADFQDIGRQLKIFDPRSTGQSVSSFMEANFFTFNGDGDSKMNFTESLEYISFLFSAGLGSGAQIQTDLQAAGCEVNEFDVMGFKKFNSSCLEDSLRRNFASEFVNLPKLVAEIQPLTSAQWDTYFQSALIATRVSDPNLGRTEISDLRAMVVVFHYIESLLKSYDTDGSQSLSLQEIYNAYPRFATYLRQAKPGYSDDDLKDGLAFLLFYGYEPSTLDMVGFKVTKTFWNFQAHRADIVKVVKVLKDEISAN